MSDEEFDSLNIEVDGRPVYDLYRNGDDIVVVFKDGNRHRHKNVYFTDFQPGHVQGLETIPIVWPKETE